jgi:2-C-methyl-D-erythritol 4-phosphate cytidylyltransferase
MVNAIIVAAGKGVRMGSAKRKQYLLVAGRPILYHTLRQFDACTSVDHICLVVPKQDLGYCYEKVTKPAKLKKPVKLIPGGLERQQSVFRGLEALDNKKGLVAIHDGVRPLIETSIIEACILNASENGACVPGIPVIDTIKRTNQKGMITSTVQRKNLWSIQTPQVFEYRIIMEAHHRAIKDAFKGTDDASLVERLGYPVAIVNGSKSNIKVTTEEDLFIASKLLAAHQSLTA